MPKKVPAVSRRAIRFTPFPVSRFKDWSESLEKAAAALAALYEDAHRNGVKEVSVDGAQGMFDDAMEALRSIRTRAVAAVRKIEAENEASSW